jgi:transposase-like protein
MIWSGGVRDEEGKAGLLGGVPGGSGKAVVLEQGQTLLSAAQRLGIPKGTLTNWVLKAKEPGAVIAPGGVSVAELAAENARLRKELAQAKLERDILKNATTRSTGECNTNAGA